MDFNFDDVILSHPHDFFRVRHLSITPGTCFVLMPFAKKFDIVFDTIEKALKGLMVCTRADDLPLSKQILERILHGIETSELIIADLTGRNSNVFYELGLAHTRTKNVLLLTQNMKEVPFDLRGFFCHTYSRDSEKELKKLTKIVRRAAEEIRAQTLPRMLEGVVERTRRIVDHMQEQLNSPKGVKNLILRTQASISSIGNTARTKFSEPDRKEYSEFLEDEGRLMIELIEKGASLQAIISPHVTSIGTRETDEERKARLDRLMEFITNRDDCMGRCQFAISPTSGANLMFFGEEILFEGHKTEIQRGFGWTMVYTDKAFLNTRIGIFDRLFESARQYTIENYGKGIQSDSENELLRNAVLKALHKLRDPLT